MAAEAATQLALDLPARTRRISAAVAELPRQVRNALRFLDLVEDELATAGLPKSLNGRVFRASLPGPLLRDRGEHLYRAHVRELITRARAGKPLAPGTDAECLAAMMETALLAPLRAEGLAVAERLFGRVMPERAREVIGEHPTPERWAGQVDEDVAAMRKRLAVPERDVEVGDAR